MGLHGIGLHGTGLRGTGLRGTGLHGPRDRRGLCAGIGAELHQTISVLGLARWFLPIPARVEGDLVFEPEVWANVTIALAVPSLGWRHLIGKPDCTHDVSEPRCECSPVGPVPRASRRQPRLPVRTLLSQRPAPCPCDGSPIGSRRMPPTMGLFSSGCRGHGPFGCRG